MNQRRARRVARMTARKTRADQMISKRFDTFTNMETDTDAFVLCKIKRIPHQMDIINIPNYLSSQADKGFTFIKDNQVYIECGNNNKCKNLICLDTILEKIKERSKEVGKNFIENDLIQKITLKSYENSGLFTYCPNHKCKGAQGFMLESILSGGVICPFQGCGKVWCPICKTTPYHDGYTCSQAKRLAREKNKDDPDVKYMIENTQLCPKCNYAVEKGDAGCDHMQCKCGTYFCYVCGTLLDDSYQRHIVYDEKKDIYVCPKRLHEIKEGLAKKEIMNDPQDFDDNEEDDEDDDDNFDERLKLAIDDSKNSTQDTEFHKQIEQAIINSLKEFSLEDTPMDGMINTFQNIMPHLDSKFGDTHNPVLNEFIFYVNETKNGIAISSEFSFQINKKNEKNNYVNSDNEYETFDNIEPDSDEEYIDSDGEDYQNINYDSDIDLEQNDPDEHVVLKYDDNYYDSDGDTAVELS
jgi:hypothetical protein